MKRLGYLFILLCCINHTIAQNTDSIVQYRFIESAFTEKSKSTTDKRHYEYFPLNMRAGDIALIEYTSTDFVEALMVRDSLGHQGVKEDDTTFFKTIGSKITLPFKAPADGPYYFVFMTKEPKKTGKFQAHIFIYNSRNNHISTNSSFCEKLKYITGNSYTGFEFLKDKEQQGVMGSYFTSTINLLPGSVNQVNHDMGDSYSCNFPSSADLAGLKKKFDDLEHNISSCLPDHKKKVYTPETLPDFEKKNFVRKVEFTLSGSYPKDLNGIHALSGIKDRVILQLDKDGANKYRLKVEIE